MAKLYDLALHYQKLNEMIEDAIANDGNEEDLEMFQDTLESINDAMEIKAENIVKLLKNMQSDIDAFKNEEKRLAQRRKYLENKHDSLKAYLADMLKLSGKKEVQTGLFKLKFCKTNPSVEVVNEGLVPQEFREPVPDKILKKEILQAIKEGKLVPGTLYITNKEHLRIS